MLSSTNAAGEGGHSILSSIKNGLFGALYVISKQHYASKITGYIELLIKTMQWLSFVLNFDTGVSWQKDSAAGISLAFGLTSVTGYADWFTSSAFLGLFYFSLLWVSLFVSLYVWAMVSFARGSFSALWPLKLLRSIGSFSANLLYIPMLTVLLTGFRCENEDVLYRGTEDNMSWWRVSGYTCSSPGFVVQIIITALVVSLFVLLCAVWSACVQDMHPLSTNLSAKVHGRMDFCLLCFETLLVCMISGWPKQVPTAAHLAVLIAAACAWLGFSVFAQPYIHHAMNRANAAAAAVLLACCIFSVVATAHPAFDGAIGWYICVPFAAGLGAWLTDARAVHVATCSPDALSSVFDVELRGRFMLHEILYGHATATVPVDQRPIVVHQTGTSLSRQAKVNEENVDEGDIAMDLKALGQEDDVDVRASIVRRILVTASSSTGQDLTVDHVARISKVYVAALSKFRYSPLLHMCVSTFHATISGNKHLQMSHLLQAERKSPGLDLQYFIFATRRATEEKTGSVGGKQGASALARVAFEKYAADARKAVTVCLTAQSQFWAEMATSQPSLGQLHLLADRIVSSIMAADAAFVELSRMNARSLNIIRMQAEYTLYALNDSHRAAALVTEAERLEEAQNKELRAAQGARLKPMEVSNVDVMAESAGVVVISSAPGSLGMILSASSAACRMFGYPKWQMERRQVDIIIPAPIAEWHTQALRRFLATGNGRAVDVTRMILGQHKSGFIFPMMLTVREAAGTDGPPSLVAIMHPITSDDDYLICDPNMAVCAASQRSMAAFNLNTSLLTSKEITLNALIPDLEGKMKDLTSDTGMVVEVYPVTTHSDEPGAHGIESRTPVDGEGGETGRVNRRASLAARLHNDRGIMYKSADLKVVRGADNRVYVRAWVQTHSTLTGHTFHTVVWAPAKAPAGAAKGGVGLIADATVSPRREASDRPPTALVRGSRQTTEPASVHSRGLSREEAHGLRQPATGGCPFIATLPSAPPSQVSLAVAIPTGHVSTTDRGASGTPVRMQAGGTPVAGGLGGRLSFMGHLASRGSMEEGEDLQPISVQQQGGTGRFEPSPVLDLSPAAILGHSKLGPLSTLDSEDEKDGRSDRSVERQETHLQTSTSARGSGLGERLGVLRANSVAAMSPTAALASGRASDRDSLGRTEEEHRRMRPLAIRAGRGSPKHAPVASFQDSASRPVPMREPMPGTGGGTHSRNKTAPRVNSLRRRSTVDTENVEPFTYDLDSQHGSKTRDSASKPHLARRGSAGGRSSNTSGSSSSRNKQILAKLRKVVEDIDKQPIIPQLRLLRLVALTVSVIAASVATGLNVYAANTLNQISRGAESTFLAGNLYDSVMFGTQAITAVVYENLGLHVTHPSLNQSAFQEQQKQMAAAQMRRAIVKEKQMFDSAQSVAADFVALFQAPSLDYIRVGTNGLTGEAVRTTVRLSIHDALSQYLLAMVRLASQEVAAVTVDQADFQLLASNGNPGQDFTERLNVSASSAVAYLTREASRVSDLLAIVFAVTLSVLAGACLTIMLPAVLSLDAARDKALLSIMVLPPIILNTMRAQAEQQLEAFRAADEVDDDGSGSQEGSGENSIAMDDDRGGLHEQDVTAVLPLNDSGEYDWGMVSAHAKSVRKAAASASSQSAQGGGVSNAVGASDARCACCRRSRGSAGSSHGYDREGSFRNLMSAALGRSGRLLAMPAVSPAWTHQSRSRAKPKPPMLVLKLLVLFNFPLIFLFILLGVSMTQTDNLIFQGIRDVHVAVASQYRLANLRASFVTLRRSIRRFVPAEDVVTDVAECRAAIAGLRYWSDILLTNPVLSAAAVRHLAPEDTKGRASGLLRGQPNDGRTERETAMLAGMKSGSQLCAEVYRTEAADLTILPSVQACESWPEGTRSAMAGLARVEDDWIRASIRLLDRRAVSDSFNATSGVSRPADAPPRSYSPADEFASPTMTSLITSTVGILVPAYRLQTDMLQSVVQRRFAGFAVFQTALLSSCLVLYLSTLLLVYVLLVPAINVSLLRQRALLLMLPVPLFDHPTAIGVKEMVNTALASSGITVSVSRGHAGGGGSSAKGSTSR